MDSLRIAAGRLGLRLTRGPGFAGLGFAGLVLVSLAICALVSSTMAAPGDDPAASADADRDTHNLVLLAPEHPVLVQIRVQVDGRGLRSVRAAYAAQLVKLYDKDDDGLLDKEEARLVPPLVIGHGCLTK